MELLRQTAKVYAQLLDHGQYEILIGPCLLTVITGSDLAITFFYQPAL